MKSLEEIKKTIDEHKSILKEKFKINSIGICGSYVRKAEKAKSDIDILVDFYETIDLFEFVELEDFLREILNVKVNFSRPFKNKGYNGEKKTFQNLWGTERYSCKQKKRSSDEDVFTLTLTGYPPPSYWINHIITHVPHFFVGFYRQIK